MADDIRFITTVSHGIVRYWEKSDYDMPLTEHPTLVILFPLPLFSCSYHYKKNNNPGAKSCFVKVLSAVEVTVVFPETLWPSGGKLVHVRIFK